MSQSLVCLLRSVLCSVWLLAHPSVTAQLPDLDDRLAALSPDDPVAYFELGEEIADAASTPEERAVAQRLYVLSFSIASEGELHRWLLPSSCLALAAIEPGEERRAWLRALASLTDPRYTAAPAASGLELDAQAAAAALRLAEFVGLSRAGLGRLARDRLEDPAVQALAEQIHIEPSSRSRPIAISRLRSEAAIWPCPECANARTIPDPDDRRSSVIYCPTCRGDPGPLLTPKEFVGAVVLEAVLLEAGATSWSADLALGLDRPIRDPSPAELAAMYGVDTAARWFINGEWSASPADQTDG
ncbi:MAG: hypothetical protein AAGF47_00430 [Planctomycetota bacterium]